MSLQETFDRAVKQYMENEAKENRPLPTTLEEEEDIRDYWMEQALEDCFEIKKEEKEKLKKQVDDLLSKDKNEFYELTNYDAKKVYVPISKELLKDFPSLLEDYAVLNKKWGDEALENSEEASIIAYWLRFSDELKELLEQIQFNIDEWEKDELDDSF